MKVPQRTRATELRKDAGVSLSDIVQDTDTVSCYSGRAAATALASLGSLLEIDSNL